MYSVEDREGSSLNQKRAKGKKSHLTLFIMSVKKLKSAADRFPHTAI